MIAKVFSDIHLEFHDRHNQMHFVDQLINDKIADVIVIAGDLAVGKEAIEWLKYIDKNVNIPVVYTSGNHEYYGTQKVSLDETFHQANKEFKNVKVLIQDTFEFMGVTFAGSTGWWDSPMSKAHLYSLNDFNRIYDIMVNGNGTMWGVSDKRFFQKVLEKSSNVVCISHNAPSWNSIDAKYKGSDINECFANHWDKMIQDNYPIAWVHGHMHDSCEYRIGKTQIVCNPYGYYGYEVNSRFNKEFYLQVL